MDAPQICKKRRAKFFQRGNLTAQTAQTAKIGMNGGHGPRPESVKNAVQCPERSPST